MASQIFIKTSGIANIWCVVFEGPPASQAGSWRVVGNSGAVALQALPFTNDLVLFMARPLNENGGGDASLTNLLTVRTTPLAFPGASQLSTA